MGKSCSSSYTPVIADEKFTTGIVVCSLGMEKSESVSLWGRSLQDWERDRILVLQCRNKNTLFLHLLSVALFLNASSCALKLSLQELFVPH